MMPPYASRASTSFRRTRSAGEIPITLSLVDLHHLYPINAVPICALLRSPRQSQSTCHSDHKRKGAIVKLLSHLTMAPLADRVRHRAQCLRARMDIGYYPILFGLFTHRRNIFGSVGSQGRPDPSCRPIS